MSIILHSEAVPSNMKIRGKCTYSRRYLFLVRTININMKAKKQKNKKNPMRPILKEKQSKRDSQFSEALNNQTLHPLFCNC